MAVLYPQEMMLKLQLFISIFYRSLPTSCSLSLKAVKMLPPLVSG